MKLVYTLLLAVALLLIECMVGGTRLVFCLPSYGIIAAAGMLSLASLRQPVGRPSLVCLGTSAVFFAYILGRAALSPVPYLAWMDFYMVLGCLAVYLLTALYLTQTRLQTVVIVALLGLAVVEVFFGLRQFTRADNWMPFGFTRSDYGGRASGSFVSSISLAGYLEAVGIFALSLAVWSTWKVWARIGLAYLALVCYLGVAITGSRGGYLSSAFSLVVFAIVTLWIRRKTSPSRFANTALIAALALGLGLGSGLLAMQQSTLLRTRLSLIGKPDIRRYNWAAALDQFKVSPWVGTGAGTHLYFGRLFRRPQLQYDPEHAHNDYLELLAEYGLIGAIGMAAFLVAHLSSGFRNLDQIVKTAREDRYDSFRDDRLALQVGAIGAIAAYLAHSVTDFNLHIPGNALMFAFIFGLTTSREPTEAAPTTGIRVYQFALPALGLFIAIAGLPNFPGDYWTEKARAAMHYREFDRAADCAGLALQHESRNPAAYYLLAGAYAGLAHREVDASAKRAVLLKAADAAERSLEIFPYDQHALGRLAAIFDELHRFREAGEAYQKAIALDPNLGALRAFYARHLAAVGRLDEGREQLEKARALGSAKDPTAIVKGTPLDQPAEE